MTEETAQPEIETIRERIAAVYETMPTERRIELAAILGDLIVLSWRSGARAASAVAGDAVDALVRLGEPLDVLADPAQLGPMEGEHRIATLASWIEA